MDKQITVYRLSVGTKRYPLKRYYWRKCHAKRLARAIGHGRIDKVRLPDDAFIHSLVEAATKNLRAVGLA